MQDVLVGGRIRRKHWALWLLIAALLVPGAASVSAQDDPSDDGQVEITIVVQPGKPGPKPDKPDQEKPGDLHLPGTVSAWIVLVRDHELTSDPDDQAMLLAVRDDRGTGAGWAVHLFYTEAAVERVIPNVIENRDATIRRILPDDGRLSDQIGDVRGGRSLGPLSPAIPLLDAAPRSGSGVFLQTVTLAPRTEPGDVPDTMFIVLPAAP